MTPKHAHGMECCWPCFRGVAAHPVPDEDGEPDPHCDGNCPPADEDEA